MFYNWLLFEYKKAGLNFFDNRFFFFQSQPLSSRTHLGNATAFQKVITRCGDSIILHESMNS